LLAVCREVEEILAVATDAPPMPALLPMVEQVLTETAQNISSTLQDTRRGRPTELPELNGYLCELAREADLPSPVNEWLVASVSG
jgi:2-dehydropantoate 2-reductase